MDFLGFLFIWIGKAWNGVWKTILSENARLMLLTIAGIAGTAYVGWNVFKVDGKIDYCRVERTDNLDYKLEGHRPWREDKVLMQSQDRPALLKAAKEDYHCEIH